MGTGSVDDRYCSGYPLCRRCLSPFFGRRPWDAVEKGGQAPSRGDFDGIWASNTVQRSVAGDRMTG